MNIMAEELVPGDIVRLQSGDRVVGVCMCMYVCMYLIDNTHILNMYSLPMLGLLCEIT